ncbi:hypothetical protein N752_05000 [Desulforamulus aquiferis]|nr:hypothetical protein N752_05000 [Desulforamulus aquiferis]
MNKYNKVGKEKPEEKARTENKEAPGEGTEMS